MEVVNVGSISVDEAIAVLLDRQALQKLVGWHGAVCFALVREITAQDFYGRLIENVSTIDATTRNHIAFVVFYGERSAIAHPVSTSYQPYLARYQVQGMSTSTHKERDSVEFDVDLSGRFRDSPSEISRPALTQSMGRATRLLMERYSVPETALPCLLFIDSRDPMNAFPARLSATDPLRSLYEDALKPLSQEFSICRGSGDRRDEIMRKWRILNDPDGKLRHLARAIAWRDDRLRRHGTDPAGAATRYLNELSQWREVQQAIEGRLDDPTLCATIEHLPIAERVMRRLRGYEHRVARARMIEEQLGSEQQGHRRRRLERLLDDLNYSIEKKDADITGLIEDAISQLEEDVRQVESDQAEKQSLEQELGDAKALLQEQTFETLDQELADLEQPLRDRGYGDDVLTDPSPAAFSVVKLLHDTNRLGVEEPEPQVGDGPSMRILFLAANPMQTGRLDLELELRTLEDELGGVAFRESISLVAKHAVRPDDLVRHVRRLKPNVIHFSGHGSSGGIFLRDDTDSFRLVTPDSLERFLKGRDIDLVVLNACYTKEQAELISGAVKAVVGTTHAVDDEAARRFTTAFYRALGEGASVREAFKDGGDSVALHGLEDVFHSEGDVDLTLVSSPTS